MTLDEKIGQMTQLCASSITLDGTKNLNLNTDKIRGYIVQNHVGSFLSGTGPKAKWAAFITAIQKIAVEETRLGIPIIFGIDHVHGANYVDEGTMLPHQLNLACSFDTGLVAACSRLTAAETAPLGMNWNFAPVLDIGRNPTWPRFYETFGEDPLVCAKLGKAAIQAQEGYNAKGLAGIAACGKHFIGYSDPRSGYDRTPSEIPDQVLYEWHIPAFDTAIRAGVKTMMINSGELNGEPVHGSAWLLDTLLRQQLGFKGVLVTDIKDINKIVTMHGGAVSEREATHMAINAGIDVSMACNSLDFQTHVKALLAEGQIKQAQIDSAVKRILTLKFDLGLFEHPYPSLVTPTKKDMAYAEKLAIDAAAAGIVLLRNDSLLPLPKTGRKVLLAGLGATSKRILNGPWTLEWQGAPEARQPGNMLTLAQALQKQGLPLTISSGPDTTKSDSLAYLARLKMEAASADLVVLTIGEQPYSEFKGNNPSPYLHPYHQLMIDQAKGKPFVLIMLAGRPKLFSVPGGQIAIIWAGIPGSGGGPALAELLTGKRDFTGILAFTYPKYPQHQTPYYVKRSDTYSYAYPFGHGLRYGKTESSGFKVSNSYVTKTQSVQGSVNLANNGKLPTSETILIYLQDSVGTITRPQRKLVWFGKVALQPGERKTVAFTIPSAAFAYPDKRGRYLFEPGPIHLLCAEQKVRLELK